MDDKDTIETYPDPDTPDIDTTDVAAHNIGSTDSNFLYSLGNHKFAPYYTNTTKNQKKEGKTIDDKFIINTTHTTDLPDTDNPNDFT